MPMAPEAVVAATRSGGHEARIGRSAVDVFLAPVVAVFRGRSALWPPPWFAGF